jgi:hypothetical protein
MLSSTAFTSSNWDQFWFWQTDQYDYVKPGSFWMETTGINQLSILYFQAV